MSGKRPLTRSELDLWRRSTADVKPLADMPMNGVSPLDPDRKPNATSGRLKPERSAEIGASTAPAPAAPRALDTARPVDIDRRNWERLRRGRIEIERTLDLHGQTQVEAHGALTRFLTMASAAGLRCVLVVTGKGGVDGKGVLRQMVPRWLGEADNRPKVLTWCPAQPRHGGDGALYVLLRRRRNGERR